MELNLTKDVKDKKNSFFKHFNNKRKTKENMGPLLDGRGTLLKKGCREGRVTGCFHFISLH